MDHFVDLRFSGAKCNARGVPGGPQVEFVVVNAIVRPWTGPVSNGTMVPQLMIAVQSPHDGLYRWLTTKNSPGRGRICLVADDNDLAPSGWEAFDIVESN